MPAGRGQQSSQQTIIIVGGAIGAVVLILGGVLFLGSGERRTRSSAPTSSGGRMTPEEARRLKKEGKAELAKGEALYGQRGTFGGPGFAAKVNEARGHFNRAMENFNKIPNYLSDPELEALSTQCARLLNQCFKVPIDTH
ncbi:MAG: hypothetical protein ACYTKD_25770 [Planctomycetota bacterium]|jgi:hypothetical protein